MIQLPDGTGKEENWLEPDEGFQCSCVPIIDVMDRTISHYHTPGNGISTYGPYMRMKIERESNV